METRLIYCGTSGDRIIAFIREVVRKRPDNTECYLRFNDTTVMVKPTDSEDTIYQHWLIARGEKE